MRALILTVAGCAVLGAAVAFSRPDKAKEFDAKQEARNPWTSTRLNNDRDEFQFVIVTDRTGGHREKVFSRAVERINLLQPEFVLSVGDLIEGGNKKPEQLAREWEEFDG